ncbi:hypothetical protein Srubr_36990 [Streptomyces rubradiris]|uniref:Uncharacterized protein n=1 Tax=Streptomyces rubradiris TaxID=285531 RepID=A0ABQ3RDD7_STRRR|nr:hypothetical protein GCM10018792_05900 [Streptomyces rubradiris]GHI53853.1 hypothetical protein Srubr_36990 [Streptomyces rubradiris]
MPPWDRPTAWPAGPLLLVGASLSRQVVALVYLSGRAVFVALTLRFYGVRESNGRI